MISDRASQDRRGRLWTSGEEDGGRKKKTELSEKQEAPSGGAGTPTAVGTQNVAAQARTASARPGMLCITTILIDWCPLDRRAGLCALCVDDGSLGTAGGQNNNESFFCVVPTNGAEPRGYLISIGASAFFFGISNRFDRRRCRSFATTARIPAKTQAPSPPHNDLKKSSLPRPVMGPYLNNELANSLMHAWMGTIMGTDRRRGGGMVLLLLQQQQQQQQGREGEGKGKSWSPVRRWP